MSTRTPSLRRRARRSRGGAGTLAATLAVGLAGCAANGLVLDGESRGKTIDLHLAGRLEGGSGKLTLDVSNHAGDAIAIDLDSIRLGDPQKDGQAPLGRPQTFRSEDGKKVTRRVSLGATTIPPGAHQQIELEFEHLPAGATYALAVPTMYRMGIDGQVNLKGVKLPVHVEKQEIPPHNPDGWFDPFEQW